MSTSARPSDRHLEAARLYLSGPPGYRDNWDSSCRRAGFERVPDKETQVAQAALRQMRNAPETVDDDLKALDDRLSGSGTPDWEELASIARRVLGKIGAGLIDQSPGQVSALKEIINRAEGKVGAGQRDEGPIGVVVLPALMDQDRLPYLDVDQEESIGERHNRMARQAARRESWEEARTIPGGGYRDEEYGGRA